MPEPLNPPFPGWPRVGGGAEDTDPGAGGGEAGATPPAAGEGGEPTDIASLTKVAEDFEAEALAEMGETPAAGKGEGEGEGKGAERRTPPAADPLDEFIEKNYGGDKAAFVASLHESRAEAKRLADEVAVLKSRTPEPSARDAEAEVKAALEQDSDVQSLNQEIKSYDDRNRAIGARQLEIINDANTLQVQIAQLEAELPHITEDTKEWAKKYAALSRARTDLATKTSEFQTNELRQEQLQGRKATAQRELKRTEREIRDRLSAEEQQSRADAADAERTRGQFSAAFDALIKPFNLEAGGKKMRFVRESVRTQLADYLESLGEEEGLDAAGIYESVGKLIAAYAEAHDMRPAGAPKPKAPVVPRPVHVPKVPGAQAATALRTGTAPRTPDDVLSNPDLVRKRAAAVFEAAQKAGQKRAGLA